MSDAGLSDLGKTLRIGLVAIGIPLLLAGCGAVAGNAGLGPNPGGGFYGAPNLNVGRVNP
jgi:hypothetical protein